MSSFTSCALLLAFPLFGGPTADWERSQSLTRPPRDSNWGRPGGRGADCSVKLVNVANAPLRVIPNHVPPPVESRALNTRHPGVAASSPPEAEVAAGEEEEEEEGGAEKSCQAAASVGRARNSSRLDAITRSYCGSSTDQNITHIVPIQVLRSPQRRKRR